MPTNEESAAVAAKMRADGRCPMPGGHGLRQPAGAPGCAGAGAEALLARRAFIDIGLIAEEPGDDIRFAAIDNLWKLEVDRWFAQAPGPLNAVDPLARPWVMLAAMRKGGFEPRDIEADALFHRAVARLCPAFSTTALDLATADARDRAWARLATHPAPLPGDPLTCRGPANAAQDYLDHLQSSAPQGGLWRRRAFVKAARAWFAEAAKVGEIGGVAAAALALFASMTPGDAAAIVVCTLWEEQVDEWFQRATPPLGALSPGDKRWLMLAAMHSVAPPSGSAATWPAAAAAGLGLSSPPPGIAVGRAVVAALLKSAHPIPLPWAMQPSVDDHFVHLSSLYSRSERWVGKNFVAAAGQWFSAVSTGNAQQAASATLACIGGERSLRWNWPVSEFVDAAQHWCIRQVAEGAAPIAAICKLHLRQRSHAELVVHGLAWLCGIHPAVAAPPAGIRQAAIDHARAADWLARAARRVDEIVADRHQRNPAHVRLAQRYQPPGNAKFAATPQQWQALERECARHAGRNRLRGRYFLRVLHSQLQFAAPTGRHEYHREGFHVQVSSVLETAATEPSCGVAGYAQDLREALAALWLFGGDLLIDPADTTTPDCFQPHALGPLPGEADLELNLGPLIGGLQRTRRLALLVLDLLTDPLQAARGGFFKRDQYKYLENVLRDPSKRGAYPPQPVFYAVRQANWRLTKVLGQDNLQRQVRRWRDCCAGRQPPARCALCLA